MGLEPLQPHVIRYLVLAQRYDIPWDVGSLFDPPTGLFARPQKCQRIIYFLSQLTFLRHLNHHHHRHLFLPPPTPRMFYFLLLPPFLPPTRLVSSPPSLPSFLVLNSLLTLPPLPPSPSWILITLSLSSSFLCQHLLRLS